MSNEEAGTPSYGDLARVTRIIPLCVGIVLDLTTFSSRQALPSPTSAKDCSSLFGRFAGTMAWSDSSATYTSAVRLSTFSDRSRFHREVAEVSRFSRMLFLDVLRFSDYAGPDVHSRSTAYARVAFPSPSRGRRPRTSIFSKLNSPARRCPCLRFG